MSEKEKQQIVSEVNILRELNHPHIVKYYETYDDTNHIYMCMELCTGGELYSKMAK